MAKLHGTESFHVSVTSQILYKFMVAECRGLNLQSLKNRGAA